MTEHVSKNRVLKALTAVLLVGGVMLTGCELATFAGDARRKGIALYEQGNFTDAAGSFQNAVKQLPTDYRSFYWLGLSYEKLDQNQRAIQAFKAARDTRLETMEGIQDKAMKENIYNALARAIAASASRDAEIDILKKRSVTARNGDDLIVLARVFRDAGDPDSAIATYQQAVDRYPRDQDYGLEFGKYLTSVGLKERARQVLAAAASIKPNSDVQAALKAAEAN